MRRFLFLLVAAVALLGTGPPAAASAGPGVNPARYCDESFFEWTTFDGRVIEAYWVPMRSATGVLLGFSIEAREGCISTVAGGMRDGVVSSSRFTVPATRAQCAYLEEEFGLTYPTRLYGKFDVRNRTECGLVLRELLAILPPPTNGPPL